jgi:CRISPR-associated protein Csb2
MARVQGVLGPQAKLAPFFSGHADNGAPARRDSSSHIAFAFTPISKRLLVIAPHVLERRGPVGAELDHLRTLDDALDGLRELLAGAAGRLRLLSTAVDASNDMLLGRSREWASVTPYVVTRHAKGLSASEALAIDVRSECRRVGLPEPRIESRDVRGVAGLGLVGNVRLSFQVAVVGPIMIGRNRYFGGGLFQHSQP